MMTSKDNQKTTQDKVTEKVSLHLNASVDSLSAETQAQLYQARMRALATAKKTSTQTNIKGQRKPTWLPVSVSFATAVALAVTLTMQSGEQDIPAIPRGVLGADMPTEELMMLENLEFTIWLAEHEADNI